MKRFAFVIEHKRGHERFTCVGKIGCQSQDTTLEQVLLFQEPRRRLDKRLQKYIAVVGQAFVGFGSNVALGLDTILFQDTFDRVGKCLVGHVAGIIQIHSLVRDPVSVSPLVWLILTDILHVSFQMIRMICGVVCVFGIRRIRMKGRVGTEGR